MIMMEALCYQNYGGRWYIIGDTIPVETEAEAVDMVAMNLARRKKAPAEQQVNVVIHAQRSMDPETNAPELPAPSEETKKATHPPQVKRGQYVTRTARAR